MVAADTGAIAIGEGVVATTGGPRPIVKYAFEAVGTFSLVLTVGAAVESVVRWHLWGSARC